MSLVTLVTPTPPDISSFGVRSLSAYLRAQGHQTRLVFLPGSVHHLDPGGEDAYRYPERVMEQILDICRGSDLVGLSFFTSYFDRAVRITQAVKQRLNLPVIWGGIHATCKPAEAVGIADFACVGEGEQALTQLLAALQKGAGHDEVPGIWTRAGDGIKDNGRAPLIDDLDALPFFDVSNQDHYVHALDRNEIVALDDALYQEILPLVPYFKSRQLVAYRTMADRGCPHACTYCNVPTIKDMYQGSGTPYFRHRGVDHVLTELIEMRRRFPRVGALQLFDDTFFARPKKWLVDFAARYKGEVGLPFYCQASPTTLSAEKLEILMEAGLVYVEMGIQTGSTRIRKRYNRHETNRELVEGAKLVAAQVDKKRLLPPDYHVIIDNPWETPEDTLDTVRLLFDIPKPFGLCIASLIFFPHTGLYRQALAEGLIKDELAEVYRRPFFLPPKKSYPNFLLYLLTFQHFPRWLMKRLMDAKVVAFMEAKNPAPLYQVCYKLGEAVRLVAKGFKTAAHGQWGRFGRYFKARRAADGVETGAERGRKG